MTTWPNAESAVNSDPWLVAHHDELALMRPRVLAVNFVHGLSEARARALLERLCAALRESSRWQGRAATSSSTTRSTEIVDLTEPRGTVDRNSAQFPRTPDGVHFEYGELYEQVPLAEREDINEVWLLADHTERSAPWETVEVKKSYAAGRGFERYAGNSGEHTAPWIGRSLRILFVNFTRGVGCAMESLGHSLERMATCGAIPYYERYFREYAGLDLDRRYGLPFESLYGQGRVDYPSRVDAPVRLGLAQAQAAGLRRGRRQRALHAQRALRLRPRRRSPRCCRRSRPGASATRSPSPGPRACSSPTASSPTTAWAAGSSTGASTCPASATPPSTTTATR